MKSRHRLPLMLTAMLAAIPAAAASQQQGQGQPVTITGRVTTEQGAALTSATVFIESLNIGTITNAEGLYTLTVPAARAQGQEVVLAASMIGHTTVEVPITLRPGAEITQNFELREDPLLLDQIVVTGAGTVQQREKLGNTINTVRGEQITRAADPNVIQALAGKAPNVEISAQSGEPGASSFIRIRGPKTIQGTAQPLIVVDGVPLDNTTITTGPTGGLEFLGGTVATNRAADINPADIESIEILKGSAAAAIYGARAAAGVVLITTKSGQPGATQYSLRSSVSIDEVNKGIPLQREFGQGSGGQSDVCGAPGCSLTSLTWGPRLAGGTPTFDHFNEMFRTGVLWDNTLTVSGGNETTTYYLSGGYTDHRGTIVGPNNEYERASFRLKASHRLLDNMTLSGNVSYVQSEGDFTQKGSNISGLMLGALRTPPEFDNRQYLDPETGMHRSYRYPQPVDLAVSRGYDNPFFVVNELPNTSNLNRVFGNISLDYTPFQWLNLKYTLGTDYWADERLSVFRPSSSDWPPGRIERADYIVHNIDSNLLATFQRQFNPNFAATLTLGQNLNSRRFQQYYTDGFDFVAPDVLQLDNTINRDPNEYRELVHLESYFGQVTVDLWNQLYLTGGLRNDGSSTWGQADRRHWFPKASAAWTFTSLWCPDGDCPAGLSFGKLRAAYGETGREPEPYQTITAFTTANLFDGGWGPFLAPTYIGRGGLYTSDIRGQDELRPERTREFEAGFDLGFFDQRLAIGFTYYNAKSKDVIFTSPLPPSTGFLVQVRNAGEISNEGFEVTADYRVLTRDNLTWDLGVNWATNDNRVDRLEGATFVDMPGAFADAPGAAVEGERVGVLRGTDFVRCGRGIIIDGLNIDQACGNAPAGALFIGADGFPLVDPTERVIADPHPDWTGSVRTALTLFNKLQVTGLLDIKKGGDVWNGTKGALYHFGTHADTRIRGETRVFGQPGFHEGPVAGPGAGQQVVIDETWFTGLGGGFGPVAAQFVEDGSYVKLREVAVSYTLDNPFVQRLGLRSIDLRLAGRNLITWTDYSGIDPETNLAGAEVQLRGIDYFNNPMTRAFVISIGLNK